MILEIHIKKSQLIRGIILNQSNNYDIQNSIYDTENIQPTRRIKYSNGMNDMGQRRFGRNKKTTEDKKLKINENLNTDNYRNEIDNGMDENSNLNVILNILIKSNQELIKDNRITEEEISNYRNQNKSFIV